VIAEKALRTGLTGILLLNAIAGERNINNTPGTDTGSMRRKSISITVRKGFLVLAEGQIGGMRGKQNFLVDTGTSPSILNARIARQMGLEVTLGTLVAAGRAVQVAQTVVPELAIDPIAAISLPMKRHIPISPAISAPRSFSHGDRS
jgi:hypothetical protein